jgi:putative membrane protein
MLRLVLAALHLLALGIGLGAVWARARALAARPLDAPAARRAFAADNWWGLSGALFLGTGLWRLLAGTEKATGYYLANVVFHAKMGGFLLVVALEVWSAVTLVRWRRAAGREGAAWRPDARAAARIRAASYAQAAILAAMVVAAVAMARGYGARA